MGSKSNTLDNEVLDSVLGGPVRTLDGTVYVALYTVAPTAAGGGTEVSGGSYARVAVTNNTTNFPSASGGTKHNANVIQFAQASADWGTVVAFAIHKTLATDTPLIWGNLTASKVVQNGDTAQFNANGITYTEA